MKKYDVAVIGSGMSGLMASIYLAREGKKVAAVSKGDPICCISTGTIDMAAGNDNPIDIIKKMPAEHPYRIAGMQKTKFAMNFFTTLAESEGLQYYGDFNKNRTLFTPIGKKRETAFVPETMKDSDLKNGERIHIISFTEIKDFFPAYFTEKFENSICSEYNAGTGSTIRIAAKFEDSFFREGFLNWISGLTISEDRIGIPAVLGTESNSGIYKDITQKTGKKVFEIPTLPPSIPGLRLYRMLKGAAVKSGVDLYSGKEVSGYKINNKVITEIFLKTPGRNITIPAKAFILATGSFVSGGMKADNKQISETVFNLPVFVPKVDSWFNKDFFKPGHPFGKTGIKVDNSFRPVETNIENLFAAGSILAESEIMRYQCGHGMAITTGLAAASFCREYL